MRTKVTCMECGGEDLILDGLLRWDTVRQNWVVTEVAEPRAWCFDCNEDKEWDMVEEQDA